MLRSVAVINKYRVWKRRNAFIVKGFCVLEDPRGPEPSTPALMKPQYIAHSEFLIKQSVLYIHPANCSVIVQQCSYFTVLCGLLYSHVLWFDIL